MTPLIELLQYLFVNSKNGVAIPECLSYRTNYHRKIFSTAYNIGFFDFKVCKEFQYMTIVYISGEKGYISILEIIVVYKATCKEWE